MTQRCHESEQHPNRRGDRASHHHHCLGHGTNATPRASGPRTAPDRTLTSNADRQSWRGRRRTPTSECAPLLLLLVVIGTQQQQRDHGGCGKEPECKPRHLERPSHLRSVLACADRQLRRGRNHRALGVRTLIPWSLWHLLSGSRPVRLGNSHRRQPAIDRRPGIRAGPTARRAFHSGGGCEKHAANGCGLLGHARFRRSEHNGDTRRDGRGRRRDRCARRARLRRKRALHVNVASDAPDRQLWARPRLLTHVRPRRGLRPRSGDCPASL